MLIKLMFFIFLVCIPFTVNAQDYSNLGQFNSIADIENTIQNTAAKFGLPNAKVNIQQGNDGSADVSISSNGKVVTISFTKDEIKNASKGKFNSATQSKIISNVAQLPGFTIPTGILK